MSQDSPLAVFDHPIVGSPYAYPGRHWELDADGQTTNKRIESRRRLDLITPVPMAKRRKAPRGPTAQVDLDLAEDRRRAAGSPQPALGRRPYTTNRAEPRK